MKSISLVTRLVLIFGILAATVEPAGAQARFQIVTDKTFDSALPRDIYLEGNAIPTEKRNAVLLRNASGSRTLIALIDTSGYSSQVRNKYIGMIINEANVSICGHPLAVGSYGFGLDKPVPPGEQKAEFYIYNQAGEKVAECDAARDPEIKQPKPLQFVLGNEREPAHLYLGRYWVSLQ